MDEKRRTQHEVSRDAKLLGLAAGAYMEARDIDGKDVAARIGRSPSYVSERVTGVRFIDSQVLQGIADCAGIGLHSLMMELSSQAARMGADPKSVL